MCPFSKTPFHKLLGLEFFFYILNKNELYPKAEKNEGQNEARIELIFDPSLSHLVSIYACSHLKYRETIFKFTFHLKKDRKTDFGFSVDLTLVLSSVS